MMLKKMCSVWPQTLTNNALDNLKLLAQVSGEFLLAVVELDVLWGSFPQPVHTVTNSGSDTSGEENEQTHRKKDFFIFTMNLAPPASFYSCPVS